MSRDLDLLQGAWTITTLELDGQTMPGAMLASARVVIAGERFTSTGMGAEYSGVLMLDAAKRPPHMDMKFDKGPERGNTNPCIYELDGDTLKLCIATRGSVRPKHFRTSPGTGIALQTLTRSYADAATAAPPKPAKSAPRAKPSPAKGETTEFEGEWRMVSGVVGGAPMDADTVKWVKRVTRGRRTTVLAGPQVMMEFEFAHDASKSPKTIDYTHTAGANKGKAQLGVYKLAGGKLTILMSAPGEPRPAKVDATPKKTGTFTVWMRVV